MKKLSLTCITGNCEKDVERFLNSFQPFVDEVVMVRAIGNQKPDRTLDIAEKRGCIVSEYKNQIGNDWPHVDDFSAARNVALSLATGDWCMWADLDDTSEGMENAKSMLDSIPAEIGMVKCAYIVGDQGVTANLRERFWRNNGGFKWVNPIHENLIPIKDKEALIGKTEKVQIIHAPRTDRDCSKDRNLKILESVPKSDRTATHKFYLTMEYARKQHPDAVKMAKEFIAHPDSGSPERYEILMTLASMTEDLNSRASIYSMAISEDPSRAEALYELTAISLACGEFEKAMAYGNLMMACRWPKNPYWNHRKMFYGFFREDLFLQCLRAIGKVSQSDTKRSNMAILSNKPVISLLHATRGRPEMASKCRMNWLMMADCPERVEHIFVIDKDDEESFELDRFYTFLNEGHGPVSAWNTAAARSKGEVLIQLSDDWKPFKGWDTAIINSIGDLTKPSVLAVSDGFRKDDLLCMAICTRKRWIDQGRNMFHPEFFSMFSDNWFTYCAEKDGVLIDARSSIVFEHLHPAFGKGLIDETYERSNDGYYYKTGEGIMNRLLSGQKVSSDIEGWFDFRDVYDNLANYLPDDGTFVEVGSWKGKSAIYLYDRLLDLGKNITLKCVDTFEGDLDTGKQNILPEFLKNRGTRKITAVKNESVKESQHYKDEELDGVFIDAAHDYDSVRADIQAWRSKVKSGGFFGGHDADSEGVKKALLDCGIKHSIFGRCWIQTK